MIDWKGLYREGWKGEIVDEAFSHPAKYARGLIRQIYAHGIEQGYFKAGDVILDPFGGVALGALDAMRRGLNWVGVELEQRFVDLGGGYDCPGYTFKEWRRFHHRASRVNYTYGFHWCPDCARDMQGRTVRKDPHRYPGNIDLWNNRYARHFPGWGTARLLQGDSRLLAEVIAEAGGCVSSPPYGDGCAHTGGDDPKPEHIEGGKYRGVGIDGAISSPPYTTTEIASRLDSGADIAARKAKRASGDWEGYNRENPSSLGNLPATDKGYDAAVSSPAYAETRIGEDSRQEQIGHNVAYGSTDGQLGRMKDRGYDAAVSSPPFSEPGMQPTARHQGTRDYYRDDGREPEGDYGSTSGQLGAMKAGGFDGAVSSPPFETNLPDGCEQRGFPDLMRKNAKRGDSYSSTDGNIGNQNGSDFWTAAARSLTRCTPY